MATYSDHDQRCLDIGSGSALDRRQPRHNPNCDGCHCLFPNGLVKLYPLDESANLILCAACWAHENHYRRQRNHDHPSERWPILSWDDAQTYPPA